MGIKRRNILKDVLKSNIFIFILATSIMMVFTYNIDLLSCSGDANETWLVAKSFFSNKRYYSYTMYKGIYAFLPSVFDYYVSAFLHIPEMLILKLLNALSFAYVAVYGIPNMMRAIFKTGKVAAINRYLLVFIMVLFECNIIYFISVDMTCCLLFFALCTMAIKFFDNMEHLWRNSIIIGFLFGFNCCFSGQFFISTMIVMISFAIRLFLVFRSKKDIYYTKKYMQLLFTIGLILMSYLIVRFPNDWYMNTVVYPAKANGEWIPSGYDWILNGLSANISTINYPRNLPDYLSMGMLTKEQLSQIKDGDAIFSLSSYFDLVLHRPINFIVRWSERLFLGMFNDPQNQIFSNIFSSLSGQIIIIATMIFAFYETLKLKFKRYFDLISVEFAVYVGFLFSALVPSFGHVENRYFFTARCLIYGSFAASPFLKNVYTALKEKIKAKQYLKVCISYEFWSCMVFCLLSLIIYFALYQSEGIQ